MKRLSEFCGDLDSRNIIDIIWNSAHMIDMVIIIVICNGNIFAFFFNGMRDQFVRRICAVRIGGVSMQIKRDI